MSSLVMEKFWFLFSFSMTSVPIFLALSSEGKGMTESIEGMEGW